MNPQTPNKVYICLTSLIIFWKDLSMSVLLSLCLMSFLSNRPQICKLALKFLCPLFKNHNRQNFIHIFYRWVCSNCIKMGKIANVNSTLSNNKISIFYRNVSSTQISIFREFIKPTHYRLVSNLNYFGNVC